MRRPHHTPSFASASHAFPFLSLLLLALACSFAPSLCSAAYDPAVHREWSTLGSAAPSDGVVSVWFALRHADRPLLEKTFWEVSDPASPKYGKYLTHEQIAAIVAPSDEAISSVYDWLNQNGAFDIDIVQTRDVVRANFRVQNLEQAFKVKFYQFSRMTSKGSKTIFRASTDYKLPEVLKETVELVHGVSDFPMVSKESRFRQSDKRGSKSLSSLKLDASAQPIIYEVYARGGGHQVDVTFVPSCQDGSNTSTIVPCSDHAPAIESVVLNGFLVNDVYGSNYSQTIQPTCSIIDDTTFCVATLTDVAYYNAFTVQLIENFEDGTQSAPVATQFPVIVSPPIIPQTISALYNIPYNARVTNMSATQAVAEFEEQYYSPEDLTFFFDQMGLVNNANVTVIGPNDINNPGGEAELDIQYLMGLALDSPTTFWSIAQNSTFQSDDILKWAYEVGNYTNPPLVHSISYGQPEDQVEPYFGKGYLARSDAEFMKLALQGLSVLIACGDTGAGDLGPPPEESDCTTLHPDWPSQSPYVTAIGTTFATPIAQPICYRKMSEGGINCDDNPLGEVSVSMDAGFIWTTGGGFSNVSARPSYQDYFVGKYLATKDVLPPSSVFNKNGRGYPDFAAIGHNIMVAQNLTFGPADGTSCSAPIFGAVLTLLNDLRLNHGQPPLGFINPLFYKIAAQDSTAFRDVLVGNNRCGAQDFTPACCDYGFTATEGWDAISGLGTPNYEVLSKLVLMQS